MQYKKVLQFEMVVTLFAVFLVFFFPSFSQAAANTNVTDWIKAPDKQQDNDQPAVDTQEKESAAEGLSWWDYVRTLLAFIFVIVLLYAALKFMNKRNLKYQQNQVIQNLGGLSLGPQKSVQLVQVGDTLLVIGVGEDVQLLKEITDQQQIEKLLDSYYDKQELAATVPYIAELLGKFNKSKTPEGTEQNTESNFGEMLQNKLSNIRQQRTKEIEKWKKKENDD